MLTHTTPHGVCEKSGQTHVEPEQPMPAGQTWPQPPQFAESVSVCVHAPAQQAFVPPQTTPQAPQLLWSLLMSTSQPVLGSLSQSAKPWSHAPIAQAPLPHAAVACGKLQIRPHAPQLVGSLATSTHAPPQSK